MSRSFLIGISAIASTLAGSYAATLWEAGKVHGGVAPSEPMGIEFIKLEPISVPIIRSGAIDGYVIGRATIAVRPEDAKAHKAALVLYAGEAVFRAIYEEGFDFPALKPAGLQTLTDRMTRLANERLGWVGVQKTAIEGLSFVQRSEVRSQAVR